MMEYARTTRMNVIALTDHQFYARAQRFSKLVIGCHVASYGSIPSHTTLLSMLRLIAIAFMGQSGEVAQQRLGVIDEINEEIDLFD
jgi:DNA-binding MurR/RpiR family transcriptional regulator